MGRAADDGIDVALNTGVVVLRSIAARRSGIPLEQQPHLTACQKAAGRVFGPPCLVCTRVMVSFFGDSLRALHTRGAGAAGISSGRRLRSRA